MLLKFRIDAARERHRPIATGNHAQRNLGDYIPRQSGGHQLANRLNAKVRADLMAEIKLAGSFERRVPGSQGPQNACGARGLTLNDESHMGVRSGEKSARLKRKASLLATTDVR
jgi:hypothetical protein